MLKQLGRIAPLALVAVVLAMPQATQAGPVYGFEKITNNGNPDVGAQLTMEVNDLGGSIVELIFSNTGAISSAVAQIVFDDMLSLLDATSLVINGGTGVAFVVENNPVLPGGNDATPPFSGDYGVQASPPPPTNGINPGESLSIEYMLSGGSTYADLIAALASGEFRAGMHVISIGDPDGSDSYVNTPGMVPEPSTITLGLIGLGLVGGARLARRRRTV